MDQNEERYKNTSEMLEKYIDSTAIWKDGRVYKIKVFVASLSDLKIYVHPDHNPPHFHVKSVQRHIDAKFSLNQIELTKDKGNKITADAVKKIQSFFKLFPEKKEFLLDEYKRLNP